MGIVRAVQPATLTRLLAAKLFRRVIGKRSTLDIAIQNQDGIQQLSPSDRGFVITSCREALRHGLAIKLAAQPLVSRPWEEIDPAVSDLLLIGLTQLWVLETPPHAVVSQIVAAAKLENSTRNASGFINAVLRQASTATELYASSSAGSALPDWLSRALETHYGEAGVEAYAKNLQQPARLHLTAKTADVAKTLAEDGCAVFSDLSLGSPAGQTDPVELPRFEEGGFWVQNASSALPATLLGAQSGDAILDLCAAPGGKTLQLAANGANVVAVDFAKSRLKRLKENLYRMDLKERVQVVHADVLTWEPPERFDKILLDAPCSALGTIRRHPESFWIKTADDVPRNALRQQKMLAKAMHFLKPGGRLIYCVCSPLYAEGQAIIAQALDMGIAQRDPISEAELGMFAPCLTADGDVHVLGLEAIPDADAFFIARLKAPDLR